VGRVLPAGQPLPFIYWARPETENAVWEKFNLARFEVKKKICYCSVFDDCYVTDSSDDSKPRAVEQCTPPAKPFRPDFPRS